MNEDEKREFGSKVRRWRLDNDLSPEELAPMIGVGTRTLANVELGQQNLGRPAKILLDKLMADGIREAPGTYGSEPISSVSKVYTPEQVADMMLDPKLMEKAKQAASVLGCPLRTALAHVVDMRMKGELPK